MRKALEDLIEAVEAAINAGDWKVDGACDPTLALVRAKDALAQRKPLTDEQKYALIEKHLGLKQRRDNTVIDQYTGLFYSAKPYFDLINEAALGIKG